MKIEISNRDKESEIRNKYSGKIYREKVFKNREEKKIEKSRVSNKE